MTHGLIVFIYWKDQREEEILLSNGQQLLNFHYGDLNEYSIQYDPSISGFDEKYKDAYVYGRWLPNSQNKKPYHSGVIGVDRFVRAIVNDNNKSLHGYVSIMDSHDSIMCDEIVIKCLYQAIPDGVGIMTSIITGDNDTKYKMKRDDNNKSFVELINWKEPSIHFKQTIERMKIDNMGDKSNPLLSKNAVIVLDRDNNDSLSAHTNNEINNLNVIR